MNQDLVAIEFSPADLDAIDGALAVLEAKLDRLIVLTPEQRHKALKMGDKSEVFCRQTEMVLRQNPGMVPGDFSLEEYRLDLAALDALRPRLQRLRTLTDRADDTELALGSDIMCAALDGYHFAKIAGKGTALDLLREAMRVRLSRRSRDPGKPAA